MADDQQSQTTTTAVQATQTSACPHPEAVGTRWGDLISEERQAILKVMAGKQKEWAAEADAMRGGSPFSGVSVGKGRVVTPLTGADVFWLAVYALTGPEGMERGTVAVHGIVAVEEKLRVIPGSTTQSVLDLSALHLEGAHLYRAHLEGAHLGKAHLEGAELSESHLEGAYLAGAHLEKARLYSAHMEKANLDDAHMEGAPLQNAHLEGSFLRGAHLEGAGLWGACLEGARLEKAHMEGADLAGANLEGGRLREAHLEGASLGGTQLAGANLAGAFFSTATNLSGTKIAADKPGVVQVADVRWQDVNLAVIEQWGEVQILGDEETARQLATKPLARNSYSDEALPKEASTEEPKKVQATRHGELIRAWRAAARAYRQLASVMRDQGMNDEADRFAYRGNLCQRQLYRVQGKYLRRLGSWLLDLVSGYGYKPLRSVIAYVLIIAFFMGLYLLNAQFAAPHLTWDEALVLSISSFHGRGFFTTGITLGNNLARIAAGEAIIGLLLEITFIATFTQRFFAR